MPKFAIAAFITCQAALIGLPLICPALASAAEDAVQATPVERVAVPSAASVATSTHNLKTTLAREYAGRTPAERHALAEHLIKLAGDQSNNPAAKYAALTEARNVAGDAGDVPEAMSAVDTLAGTYQIDASDLKCKTAAALIQHRLPPAAATELAGDMGSAAEAASASGDAAGAARLAASAEAVAVASQKPNLITAARDRIQRMREQTTSAEQSAAILKRLAANPDDPQANTAAGTYLCFTKHDWTGGLPCLAKSNDPGLKAVAAAELAHPQDVKAVMALADNWWSMAEDNKALGPDMRIRAAFWYQQALPQLEGLQRILAEKRTREAAATAGGAQRVEILQAEYGNSGAHFSLASRLQAELDADPYTPIQPGNDFMGDPAPLQRKSVKLHYRIGTEQFDAEVGENDVLILPPIPPDGLLLPGASSGLKIVAARYGFQAAWVDVTEAIRRRAVNESAVIAVNNDLAGVDPRGGVGKTLAVWYELHGRRFVAVAGENGQLKFAH